MGSRPHWLTAALSSALLGFSILAQISSRTVQSVSPTPSGSCPIPGEVRIASTGPDAGKQFCCLGGVWTQCDNVTDPLDIDNLRAKTHPWFDITHPDYGAVCNGSTNDAPAILEAINDANTAGGGWVLFPQNAVCAIASAIPVPRYVGLRGAGNSAILATSAIAMVSFSDTGTTATTNTLPLGLRDIVLDGNDIATTGLYIDEVDGFTIQDVTVRRIDGWAVVWDKTQNAFATELRAFRSDHAFEIVNEAGNISCHSCETSEIDGHHLFVGDDATRANYSGGLNPPFQVSFWDSQFERQSENPITTEMIEIDKASRFTMDGSAVVMLDRTGASTMTRIVHIGTDAVLTRLRNIGINNQVADPNDSQVAIVNDGEDTTILFPRWVGYGDAPNDVIRSNAKTRVEAPSESGTFCTAFATCDPGTADLRWEEFSTAKRVSYGNNDFYGDIDVLPHAGDASASDVSIFHTGSSDALQLRNTDDTNEEDSPCIQLRNGGTTQASEDVFICSNSSGSFVVRQDDRSTNVMSVTQAGTLNATTITESSNAIPNVTESPTWTGTHTFENSITIGNGTDTDKCINWDNATTDSTLCYDDGGGIASADVLRTTGHSLQVDGGIFIRSSVPSMSFADSDTAIITSSFTSPATDTTGGSEDSQFVINTVVNGTVTERMVIDTTSNSNPFVGLSKSSTTARFGYTGTGQYVFLALSTGELTGLDIVAPNLFVGGTGPTYIWLKASDGDCGRCGIDTSDPTPVFSCSTQTCPSVTP